MADVVITNVVILSYFNAETILLLRETLAEKIVPNTYTALLDKVHVRDFVFLVENEVHRFLFVEFLWSKSKADVIKELGVAGFIRVEEGTMLINDVVEKVLNYYVLLDLARALIQIFVILGNAI